MQGRTLVLSTSQSWAMLRRTSLGRLAVVVDGAPDVFPVNVVVDHGSVVFKTAAGTKLAAADGQAVALEADAVEQDGSAWSVVVKGRARTIRGLHDSLDARSSRCGPCTRSPHRTWSGSRSPTSPAAGSGPTTPAASRRAVRRPRDTAPGTPRTGGCSNVRERVVSGRSVVADGRLVSLGPGLG